MVEAEITQKDEEAAGAELFTVPHGIRFRGWEIFSYKCPILSSSKHHEWEEDLHTSHLPEMVFGDSSLVIKHLRSGIKFHFNAFDALVGWKTEALPPVEVPAAAKWKFRNKLCQEVVLDYDYTFTTPYCGSEALETHVEYTKGEKDTELCWENCEEEIDVASLSLKEPILFYDEIIMYEDELSDNGVSLLTVKVRVMPSSWFLLLRFWLRVDGVLIRLRDTRMHCIFRDDSKVLVLREICWRESSFQALSERGYSTDLAGYRDPNNISSILPIVRREVQRLSFSSCACLHAHNRHPATLPQLKEDPWVPTCVCISGHSNVT